MLDLSGTDIDRYHIIAPLGQGGMAVVYKAYDSRLDREVAIKLIRQSAFSSEVLELVLKRFDREAKSLAKLTHPNIVSIIDYGEFEGSPYLVMPYLPGGTLKQLLGSPMPFDQAAALLAPIADALAFAHQKGIIHRDVKPGNILFTESGQPMLTDFGIARLLENEDGATLTASGMGVGTPEYMSPEQGLGHEVDGRTDIYSLGVVLYELVTGQKPYTAVTPMEIVVKQITEPCPKPSKCVPGISEEAERILLKALAKEPDDRFTSMSEYKKSLDSLSPARKESTSTVVKPPATITKKKEKDHQPESLVTMIEPRPVEETPLIPPEMKVGPSKSFFSQKWVKILIPAVVLLVAIVFGLIYLLPRDKVAQSNKLTPVKSSTPLPLKTATLSLVEIPTIIPTHESFVPPVEILRINQGSYPNTLDPQKASFVVEISHLQLIYEGLTRLNTALETVPAAAEKWEYNADATEVTFTLRRDLKYSDGTVLNAKRFEYSILRNMDPAINGGLAFVTDDITGAYEYRTADLAKSTPEQVEALKATVAVHAYDIKGNPCLDYQQTDCLILKVGTLFPAPYIHTILSLVIAYPAKEELIISGGENWWTDAANHVGNGPFILRKLEANSIAFFQSNANYWGDYARVNIEYHYITDTAAALEAYKNDQFDIISLAAEDLADVQADATLRNEIMIYPGYCTYAFMMHNGKAPFDDQKIREAFAYALDREGWVRDVLNGLGSVTLTWIPKGFPGYDSTEARWGFDSEAAKTAIAASSYGSANNLPEITLTYSDTSRNRIRNEWLVENYKKVLGITLTLNPVDMETFSRLISDPVSAPQLFIAGWCADYPDPRDWLSFYWKTGTYGQRIGYSNPVVDAKLIEADMELDTSKRMQLYADAQRMIIETVPAAFFWDNVNSYLVKPYVKNVITTPMDSGWAGIYNASNITIEK